MLTNDETILMHRAAIALAATGDKVNVKLASDINESLLASATHKAKAAAAATGRKGGAAGGRPPRAFAIGLQPGWQATAAGALEAVEMVNKELKAAGLAPTTAAAVQQAISRTGQWQRVLETDNGAAVLTVARA